MAIFKQNEEVIVKNIFRVPVERSTGAAGALRNDFTKEQASILYPQVTGLPDEEVDKYLEAGIVGPLQAAAEAKSATKTMEVYTETVEAVANNEKAVEDAVVELEALREQNPVLKTLISPAVVEALKQSDNPVARRAAQDKLSNTLIAVEVLNDKMSETNSDFWNTLTETEQGLLSAMPGGSAVYSGGGADFVDAIVSELPVVSIMNVERRKELSDRFIQLLDSNEDPTTIRKEMEAIVDEAADMGFFTDSNRLYFQDFLDLTLEEGRGAADTYQEVFAALDMFLAIAPKFADTGKLVALTTDSVKATSKALMKGIAKDNPAGAIDPALWREALVSPGAVARTPTESAAVKDVEHILRGEELAIQFRISTGEAIDDDTFAVFKEVMVAQTKANAEKNGSTRFIDATVDKDDMENIYLYEYFGTAKGRAFTSEVAAQKYADQILGEVVNLSGKKVELNWSLYKPGETITLYRGENASNTSGGDWWTTDYSKATKYGKVKSITVKIDEIAKFGAQGHGGTDEFLFASGIPKDILAKAIPAVKPNQGGWMVKKATNLPTGWYSQGIDSDTIVKDLQLWSSVSTDELGNGFFGHLGSPLSQTDWSNNAVLKQGEFGYARTMDVIYQDITATTKRVGPEAVASMDTFLRELRDGKLAHLRESPTPLEFGDRFFEVSGRAPTEGEKLLWEKVVQWNDADWYLRADMHFKRAVEKGLEVLVPQEGVEVLAAKRSPSSLTGRTAWDADAGKEVSVADLPAEANVYVLSTPMEFDGRMFDIVYSAVPKVRALKHSDVMGYNVGGHRLYYPNSTNRFVKQETEYVLADGTTRRGVPKVLMATKTEKESRKAVEQINTILTELHKIAKPSDFKKAQDYIDHVKTKNTSNSLNDLIARNSDWNTSVHSVDNLVEWATESGVDLRKLVNEVGDGQELVKGDTIIGDLTYKDVAITPGKLKTGDFRNDKVLRGFGGQKLPTISPLSSINRSLLSSAAKSTESVYITRAGMRLYRTALEKGLLSTDNITAIRNLPIRQKLENMRIHTGSVDGRKLELERKKILIRQNQRRDLDNLYHKGRERLANILWDKGGVGKLASKKLDSMSADPVAASRGIVFDAFLGWIDQLPVQGSQVAAIAAMTDGATGGRAFGMMLPTRLTLLNGHKAVAEKIAKLQEGVSGLTAKQYLDTVENIRVSGVYNVNQTLADLGSDAGGKVMFGRVRGILRTFFKEGELASRLTAYLSASIEYAAKHGPSADLTSQHARRAIMHRFDVLTHGMSSTSRTWIEQLPFAQFLGYPMRVTEWMMGGLLGGKSVLTPKQKVKLATTQIALFGTPAIPVVGWYLDWWNFKNGTDYTKEDIYEIRNGILDNLLTYLTGVETEMGRRLAYGEGLFTVMQDLQDKSFLETISGPAGSLAKNVYDSTAQMLWNMKHAETSMDFVVDDVLGILRSVKSVNSIYNAYYAIRHGNYYTRKGVLQASDMSTAEGVAIFFGVPLEKINEAWRNTEFLAKDTKHAKDLAKRINNIYSKFYIARESGDSEGEREAIVALENIYAMYPYSLLKEAGRYIDNDNISMNEELMLKLLKKQIREGKTE